jgi:hypothetical protein
MNTNAAEAGQVFEWAFRLYVYLLKKYQRKKADTVFLLQNNLKMKKFTPEN